MSVVSSGAYQAATAQVAFSRAHIPCRGRSALKKGDRITTIGGIYGTIVSIKDDTITLAIGQSNQQPTEMTVARWAIRNVEEVSVENEGEILA